MTSKTDIVKPKTVRVFDLDDFEKLLRGIKVAACMITESHQIVDEQSVIKRLNALTLNGASDGNCCSCCGVGPFETRAQQTAHYKHHWHTHNLKRKLFGKSALSLGQFNSRQDDNSSVSGSDSETESTNSKPASDLFAAATRHCKAFFTNKTGQVFCIYRCILHHKKEELSSDGEGYAWVERCQRLTIPGYQRWAVLMHVQEIISGWSEDLIGCSLVLYRAVGSTNQAALFGKNSPLNRDDFRVRALPFPTRKPTYKEVKRVHDTLASIEVYETMELFQKALIASTVKDGKAADPNAEKKKTQKSPGKPIDRAKSRERTPRELPTQMLSSEDEGPCFIDSETPVGWIKTLSEQSSKGVITNSRKDLLNDHSVSAHSSCSEQENVQEKRVKKKKKKKEEKPVKKPVVVQKIPANVKKMWKVISGNEQSSLETILEAWEGDLEEACNIQDPSDGNTALHKAAIAAKPEMVTALLTAGSDPCIRNHQLQTPYAASPHHDTRIAFRMFQAQFPDKYNYNKSQIPGPITPELLEIEKEKKAQQKRAKRQREKEKQIEKNKTNQFLQMTDSQKVKAEVPKCFLCGANLPKTPFEYDSFKFCTIRCLQNHRNVRPLHKSA
ncbi:ankyrin repeat and zinc finger domain-containing protein 1-like isoform X2 [Colias croceus]|uniref:ankyrin repeat and zinc finger domain-containing protein 1-like isoform X2 n=1 Tax=Colias crocea TaxID=72248 RepID=UPI001E27AF0F|nr:ankyrin repeat and zinc finger domain-containing protein 1-like isoform X2 [Colias croceus]